MRVDRTTFLLMATSLAGGCQSTGASNTTDPESPEQPVPVASILVEPVPPEASEPKTDPPRSSATTIQCSALPAEDECPGEGARTFCNRYQKYFRSDVAQDATSCLASLPTDAPCNQCGLTQCGMKALERAQGDADPVCADVESRCEGMGELCERYTKGLNDAGRKRLRNCLVDNCGIGIRYCLWDPSSTPCTEGGAKPIDFQF